MLENNNNYGDYNTNPTPDFNGNPSQEQAGFEPAQEQNPNQQSFFDNDGTYRMTTHEAYPIVVNPVRENVRQKKEKKPKTWLVATVSAIVGALIFSVCSPIVSQFAKPFTQSANTALPKKEKKEQIAKRRHQSHGRMDCAPVIVTII